MASKKNRSRKSNRRSPKTAGSLRAWFTARTASARAWVEGHRGHSIVIGIAGLFVASLVGGYWIAQRLESSDSDRLALETLEQMKKAAPPAKYASIDEIPGLPRYKETE